MTPRQLERAVDGLSPPLRRAVLAHLAQWQRIASRASLAALAEAVTRGDVQRVVQLVLGEPYAIIAPRWPSPTAITTALASDALVRAIATQRRAIDALSARLLPPKPPRPRSLPTPTPEPDPISVVFRPGLPAAARRAASYAGEASSYLNATAAEGVRAAVRAGLDAGINPRDVARGIRDVVGLGDSQARWVANLRVELESGRIGDALDRKLVNGPIRQTLSARLRNGKPLTPAEINKIVGVYGDKWRAWHAETVARTMTLDLVRTGQIDAMRAARDAGQYPGLAIQKRWNTTLDGRERESHHALHGSTIPLDAEWDDDGTPRDVPGGWNCRCAMTFELDDVQRST